MQKQEDSQSDIKNDKVLKSEWTRPALVVLDLKDTKSGGGSISDGALGSSGVNPAPTSGG